MKQNLVELGRRVATLCLSWSVDEKSLKDAFSTYGEVTEGIKVPEVQQHMLPGISEVAEVRTIDAGRLDPVDAAAQEARAEVRRARAAKRAGKKKVNGGPSKRRKKVVQSETSPTWSVPPAPQDFSTPTSERAACKLEAFGGVTDGYEAPPYEEVVGVMHKDSGLAKDASLFAARSSAQSCPRFTPAPKGPDNVASSLNELPRDRLYPIAQEAFEKARFKMFMGLSVAYRFVEKYERQLAEAEATLKELEERSSSSEAAIQAELAATREAVRMAREDAALANSERCQLRTNWEASQRAQEKAMAERERLQSKLEASQTARGFVEAQLKDLKASLEGMKAQAVEDFRSGQGYKNDLKKLYARSVADTTVDVTVALQAKLDRYAQRHCLVIRENMLTGDSSSSEEESEDSEEEG